MSAYIPPITHNGDVNTTFNSQDFESTYLDTFLPITGGTITGALQITGGLDNTGVISTTTLNATGGITSGADSVVLGASSTNGGGDNVCIGKNATTNGDNSVAIGKGSSTSTFDAAVAIGFGTTATKTNQIKIGNSSSTYDMEGRLNLVNNDEGDTSLITYGNAIKLYKKSNGLTIGNYGEFAVNVADTTAEPTSVPVGPRAGINVIYITDDGNTFLGNSNNNKTMNLRSINQRTYLNGYSTSGNLTIGSPRYIVSSSDRRLKENIETYDEPSIDKIMKLKPAYYNWIDDKSKKKELGFIAQDVETIIPEAVDGKKYEYEWKTDDEGEPILDASGNLQFTDQVRHRGFSDRPLIAVLVKAVQEQQQQIEALKTEMEDLKKLA